MNFVLKKIKYIFIAIIFFVGAGCASPNIALKQTAKLVNVGNFASCEQMELQNNSGNKIEVPLEIQEKLNCATGGIVLSPNSKYLLYDYLNLKADYSELKLYNLENQQIENLLEFNQELDGINCVWRHDSKIIACVAIAQEKYEGLTEIAIIEIDENGKFVKDKIIPQKEGESADFFCGAICYAGRFWFEDDNKLKYEGHNIISPDTIYTINY